MPVLFPSQASYLAQRVSLAIIKFDFTGGLARHYNIFSVNLLWNNKKCAIKLNWNENWIDFSSSIFIFNIIQWRSMILLILQTLSTCAKQTMYTVTRSRNCYSCGSSLRLERHQCLVEVREPIMRCNLSSDIKWDAAVDRQVEDVQGRRVWNFIKIQPAAVWGCGM